MLSNVYSDVIYINVDNIRISKVITLLRFLFLVYQTPKVGPNTKIKEKKG